MENECQIISDELESIMKQSQEQPPVEFERWKRGRPTKEAKEKRKIWSKWMHERLMSQHGMYAALLKEENQTDSFYLNDGKLMIAYQKPILE